MVPARQHLWSAYPTAGARALAMLFGKTRLSPRLRYSFGSARTSNGIV